MFTKYVQIFYTFFKDSRRRFERSIERSVPSRRTVGRLRSCASYVVVCVAVGPTRSSVEKITFVACRKTRLVIFWTDKSLPMTIFVSEEIFYPFCKILRRSFAVLNELNERYHVCLLRSQELASLGLPSSDPTVSLISAERLMYNHALELCQSAALDELFGNPQLVRIFRICSPNDKSKQKSCRFSVVNDIKLRMFCCIACRNKSRTTMINLF